MIPIYIDEYLLHIPKWPITQGIANWIFSYSVSDERKKDGFVHVIVSAKGLKTGRSMKGLKFIRKAENAEVNATFEERYF